MKKVSKYIVFLFFLMCVNTFAQGNDSLVIDYNLINSIPQDASVFINGEFAGKTPFRFTSDIIDSVNASEFKIKLDGYVDFVLKIDRTLLPVNKTVTLVSRSLSTIKEEIVFENKGSYFKTPRKVVPIVLSGLVTAGSAALTYYFKSLANDTYDEYLESGDRSKLDKTKRYDLFSGVSLVVFQAGLAGLIYFLLID